MKLCASFGLILQGLTALAQPNDSLAAAAAKYNVQVGVAIKSSHLRDPAAVSIIKNQFAQIVEEYEGQPESWWPSRNRPNFQALDAITAFAQNNKLAATHHALFWHQGLPSWMNSRQTPGETAAIARQMVALMGNRYSTSFSRVVVLNEPLTDAGGFRSTLWYNRPGIGYAGDPVRHAAELFHLAANAFGPNVKLAISDYGIELEGPKSDALLRLVKELRKRRVPIHAVNFQCHVDLAFNTIPNLGSMRRNLQRFADEGLELHLSEIDVALDLRTPGTPTASQLQQQADLYFRLGDQAIVQRELKGLTVWGIRDSESFVPQYRPGFGAPLLFDRNWAQKPAFWALLDRFRKLQPK